ncbi:copper chaperone PCu(A)C [Paracoccus sp. TK19116]|uniref:Copper chaperone PCu(A)C n=1 Tax=Paracoccus albicereus TaxID=2922394 RepID=A0ABT1MVI7_9RHOB|nr:copper chaperone PCu(A)C [Paracoccus albicereus]MCQ0971328.1 copper chaperone PCu(A)C [Paracoccus albicereus]
MNRFTILAASAAFTLANPVATALAHGSEDHNHDHEHSESAAETAATVAMPDANAKVQAGDLTLGAAYTRATLPNAPVAGGFLTVTNDGTTDDRLIAAASPVAGVMEIHEMAMDGDVMTMRKLEDGLPIPAGETVMLEPGGYHLMFMRLAGPLVEGESVDVTLTFEKAGDVTVPLSVQAFNARAAGDDDHQADPHAGH